MVSSEQQNVHEVEVVAFSERQGGVSRVSNPKGWTASTVKCAGGLVNVEDQVDEERQLSRQNLQACVAGSDDV